MKWGNPFKSIDSLTEEFIFQASFAVATVAVITQEKVPTDCKTFLTSCSPSLLGDQVYTGQERRSIAVQAINITWWNSPLDQFLQWLTALMSDLSEVKAGVSLSYRHSK